ncbi:Transposon TX1 uncharacterized 149 kDa protein [Linum grandiflorum]
MIICWDESIYEIEAQWEGMYVLVVILRDKLSGFQWLLVNVYGPCVHNRKLQFLNEVREVMSWWNLPHCIIGDFNLVRSADQARGGTRSRIEMEWFNGLVSDFALIELPLCGAEFTWSNLQEVASMSRLDRAFISIDWEQQFMACTLKALVRTCSDHCPILIDCQGISRIHRPWRFEIMWLEHDKFKPMLESWWGGPLRDGELLFRVAQKFKKFKGKLKTWNKEVFKHVETEIEVRLSRVDELDRIEEDGSLVEVGRMERIRLKCELDNLWKLEEISWRQKAREDWLKLGDRNTKYFHRVANFNRRRNHLDGLWSDGIQIVGQSNVAMAAVAFYSTLYEEVKVFRPFSSFLISKHLPHGMALSLETTVTEKEVWDALCSCAGEKAPGPDGFQMTFFKRNWDIVKKDVCNAVMEFFDKSSLPLSVNSTFVVLIPKKEVVEEFKDLRPISLVGSLYKLISKVLVKRMKPCLSDLISSQQCAFVDNRQILDAALIANEVIDSRIKSGKPGLVIKLDIEKAYDHVNWECLFRVLTKMGFQEKWISWIRCCVSTASFSVLVNGEASGYFRSSRGLRQGDPISPFLFIMVMEVLSGILSKLAADDLITGFYMNEAEQVGLVNHILYADDALLFCDAKEEQV